MLRYIDPMIQPEAEAKLLLTIARPSKYRRCVTFMLYRLTYLGSYNRRDLAVLSYGSLVTSLGIIIERSLGTSIERSLAIIFQAMAARGGLIQ